MKVLFVAPVEPWCRENGSSLITADLLDGLAESAGVDMTPVFLRPPPPGYPRVPTSSVEGLLLGVPGRPRWASVLHSTLRLSHPLRHRFDNSSASARISDAVRQTGFEPDLVHVEHLPLVDIGLKLGRMWQVPVAYRAHNIESALWARRLGLPSAINKPIVRYLERSEIGAIRSVDLTLAISEVDAHWARREAPESRVEVLPCSLQLARYDAVKRPPPVFDNQVCFVGGLDWAPNVDGLRWFVDEVLPRIVRDRPRAGLAVLARGADQRDWLTGRPDVHLLPAEGSAAELFAASAVSVAPLFQGGGVRIKIAESLALGCPVVATAIGAEGHSLNGTSTTDDPTEFATACVRYLDSASDEKVREGLRTDVEAHYGANQQAARLIKIWQSLLSARSRSASQAR